MSTHDVIERRVVKREGTIETMECGHTNSAPGRKHPADILPCLICTRERDSFTASPDPSARP